MNYLDFLAKTPNLSWSGVLSLFFLVLMRIIPIVSIAPFLGSKITPIPAKMGLALFLGLIFFPIVVPTAAYSTGFTVAFLGYSIKEIFIGFILGFFSSIPFYMVQTSGILIDYLRGASMMQSQDPSMQNQASPIGILYNYILIVMFFQINGPFLFFDAIMQSYQIIPPDSFFNPLFFHNEFPFWKTAIDLANKVVTIGIQLAAPALVAILMAEMFLGIANRLAPQVQIAFLGMSIKSLLGLALLWAAWFFLLKQFSYQLSSWLDVINTLVRNLTIIAPAK
ncbi:MAG: flagellar biosynthetic protein FliR [Chlamydiota bacterium]